MALRRWRVTAMITAAALVMIFYLLTSADQLTYHPDDAPPPTVPDTTPAETADDDVPVAPPPPPPPPLHWSKQPERHPVDTVIPLPTGAAATIPRLQVKPAPPSAQRAAEIERRRAAVKQAFVHSWEGYKQHAFLHDEVMPLSGQPHDPFAGWAATLVDAMDTLWLMDLTDDFELCVRALDDIDFTTTTAHDINVFETTIRYLGGFLAAYDLSRGKYPTLLTKATELGEMLMSVFDTPNRMPLVRWNWKNYVRGQPQEAATQSLIAEPGSLSLEFTRLAQLTGDAKYYDAIQRVADAMAKHQLKTRLPGMWPVVFNPRALNFNTNNGFTLGGMSDSAYEYLPKQYLLLGGVLEQPRQMYETFIEVAKKYLFMRVYNPENRYLVIPGDAKVTGRGVELTARGQHLTCFAGGMVAMGARIFNRPDEFELGAAITDGCVWSYEATNHTTGIGPEIYTFARCDTKKDPQCAWKDSMFDPEKHYRPGMRTVVDPRYLLRPEAIESVFIMYRLTGDPAWQDKAWQMFQNIERVCATDIAAAAISDVRDETPSQADSMESFWLGETLKYFYLIFADHDLMSLDQYVLNTEAHPLRRPDW